MAGKCGKVGLSANAWVGWNEEAANAYGTKVGPNGSTKFALPLSDGLEKTIERSAPPSVTQAFSDVAQVFPSVTRVAGTESFAVPYEGLEDLLLHALGELNTAPGVASGTFARYFDLSAGGRYKHATSPSLSLHCSRGIVGSGSTLPTVFSYLGAVIDSLKFSADRGGALQAEFEFVAKDASIATSNVTPAFPTAPVANFTECQVTWGGVQIPVSRFDLSIAKGIDRERFFLGETSTCEPPMKKWVVTGSLETEWDNEIRAGGVTMLADHDAGTPRELKFAFTSRTKIPGTSAQYYHLDLILPACLLGKFSPPVTQQGRITLSVPFTGYDDTVSTAPHEFRIYQQAAANYTE